MERAKDTKKLNDVLSTKNFQIIDVDAIHIHDNAAGKSTDAAQFPSRLGATTWLNDTTTVHGDKVTVATPPVPSHLSHLVDSLLTAVGASIPNSYWEMLHHMVGPDATILLPLNSYLAGRKSTVGVFTRLRKQYGLSCTITY